MAARNKLVIRNPNVVDNIRRRISRNAISIGVHGDAGIHDGVSRESFVGPLRPAEPKKSQVTVAEVYYFNEFGTSRIPERPTLRPTFSKEKVKYIGILARMSARAMEAEENGKRYNIKQAMGLLGEVVQQDIQDAIVKLKSPPNAESTIAKKKSDNPLIDTGQLVSSIRWAYVRPSTARGKKRST